MGACSSSTIRLIGFFGFGRNPGDGGNGPFSASPPNVAGSNRTGVAQCWTVSGERLYDRDTDTFATDRTLLPAVVDGSPCTNLADFENGKLVPKRAKDSGFTHRLNAQYKPNDDLMFYATWSRGFRPGGINRRGEIAPYDPDYLTNWELGWKTTFGPWRWNGADLPRHLEEVSVHLPRGEQLHRGPQRQGRQDQRHRDGRQLRLSRAAAERRRRLHGRQDQGRHLHRRIGHDAELRSRAGRWRDPCRSHRRHDRFPVGAERNALADHAEVQGNRDCSLHLAGLGRRKGPRAGIGHLQRVGAFFASNGDPACRYRAASWIRTISRDASRPRPCSMRSPGSISGTGWSRASSRTCSTRGSTSVARPRAAAARAHWSFREGRGRSDCAQGTNFSAERLSG